MFRRLVLGALLAGVCAGLVYSAIQRWQVVPIIAAAEVFESALEHDASAHEHAQATQAAPHHESAWEPRDGSERIFWTVIANILGATGFALLLIPAIAWWDRRNGGKAASMRSGVIWGATGWLCQFVWPALGLRPGLPGEAAAALHARQGWWLLAVLCAVGGFALLMLLKSKWRWLGPPLLALPFLIGAPQAEGPSFAHYAADVASQMDILKSRFVAATAIASAAQWIVLGLLSGVVVSRWLRPLLVPAFERPGIPAIE